MRIFSNNRLWTLAVLPLVAESFSLPPMPPMRQQQQQQLSSVGANVLVTITAAVPEDEKDNESVVPAPEQGRRSFVSSVLSVGLAAALPMVTPTAARAGIDPSALRNLPVEGDAAGTATRMRQIEALQKPASDLENVPFQELPSGVSFREYREGKGDAIVQGGSKVAVEMTIRCKSFATANEPGGLKYFSTKEDTDFNELAFVVGNGQVPPGLEEGMMGMKKGALRRIEIPSTMAFAAQKANQLPLPTTKDGKRRFENLFKTDATLLFEVLVTRIK